jgi:hypothetical protein
MSHRNVWIAGGIAGALSIASYLLAIFVPWPESRAGLVTSLLVVTAWPVLSVVYCHALYDFVAAERDSAANRLGFLCAVIGFATVLAMVIVQMAVNASIGEIAKGLDPTHATALRRGLRMVDHGLDVAWDMWIGMGLVLSGFALRHRSGLGPGWAWPSVALGVALIGLNAAAFPDPPTDAGLVDVGPLIGLFVPLLSSRLAVLGRRAGA